MKHIENYVLAINAELCGAKEYAEMALFWKCEGNNSRFRIYSELANDGIKHATNLHFMATEDIEKLSKQGIKAPENMQAIWNKAHKEYSEQVVSIKRLLIS